MANRLKTLFFICIFLSLVSTAWATTYYVDPTSGVDDGDCGTGTGAAACATLSYLTETRGLGSNGDTIQIAAGSMTDNTQVVLDIGVNIDGAGSSNLIITSSASPYIKAQTSVPVQSGNQTIEGFELQRGGAASVGIIFSGRSDVTIDDIKITGAYSSWNMVLTGKYGWTDSGGGFWRDNCAGSEPTCSHCDNDYTLSVNPGATDWAENVEVKDCYFSGGGNTLVRFGAIGSGTKIHDNTFTRNGTGCLITYETYWWSGVEFYNNVLEHTGTPTLNASTIALEVWHIQNDCKFYNNTTNGWFSLLGNAGMTGIDEDPYCWQFYDNTFNTSLSVGAGKEALEIADKSDKVQVYGNYFTGNYEKGIGVYGHGAITNLNIHNNVVYNIKGDGIDFAVNQSDCDVDDAYVYNNVFHFLVADRHIGILVQATPGDADGILVKNNIFINPIDAIRINSGHSTTGCYYTHNDCYNASGTCANDMGSGAFTDSSTGNITTDPGLNMSGDKPDPYYRVSSGASNVVDAGVDVGFAYYGPAPDIGRYEYWPGGGIPGPGCAGTFILENAEIH